jgi:hypothetical protein
MREFALKQVVKAGWRTEYLEFLAKNYGEKLGVKLSFNSLDQDPGETEAGVRARFLEAIKDMDMIERVGQEKLYETISAIHKDVLRSTSTDHQGARPPVRPERTNGFEDIEASSNWLSDERVYISWFDYLKEILGDAPPFSYLTMAGDQLSRETHSRSINSHAILPHYLERDIATSESLKVERNDYLRDAVAPLDVAVRVDVSDWGELDEFRLFERDDVATPSSTFVDDSPNQGGLV